MRKLRWIIASIILCTIWIVERTGPTEIRETMHRIVYSHDDIILVRTAMKEIKGEEEIIPVYQESNMNIHSIKPYEDGFLVSSKETFLKAKGPGIILYTGMSREHNKMMTVYYDLEEVKVTYGHLSTIKQLPYIVIDRDIPLAKLSKQKRFFIQIEGPDGIYSLEETMRWLEIE